MLANQNKALQAQLNEMKRKQAESDCKVWFEKREKEKELARKEGSNKEKRLIDGESNFVLVQLNEM